VNVRRRLVLTGLLVAALGAVPITALGISVSSAAEHNLRDEVLQRVQTTAEASGQLLDDAFTQGIAGVQTTAERATFVELVRQAVTSGDATTLDATLKPYAAADGITAAFVTRLDGTVLTSNPAGLVDDAQVMAWAEATAPDGPPTTSDAFDLGDRGPVLAATSMVRTPGAAPVGILGVLFDVTSI
jgi:hypothetical protein